MEDTCSVQGCARPRLAKGFCSPHYQRWHKTGDPGSAELRKLPSVYPPTCAVKGCDRSSRARGMCSMHWKRWRKTGDPGPAESSVREGCSVPGCDRKHAGLGFCQRHYKRFVKSGDPHVVPPNPSWRGEDVGYFGLHQRLRSERGPASGHPCAHCPRRASNWAYDYRPDDGFVRYEPKSGMPYSTDLERYMPLCSSCHKLHDRAIGKAQDSA